MTRVEQQKPEDDSGAQAQANFFYQHCCAASWCIRSLGDSPTVAKVICETFEDFVVVRTDGCSELVSVKHREGRTWTVASLISEGVLGGLLDRWQVLGEEPACRFMTNADWASGSTETSGLRECCLDGDPVQRQAWADRLAPRLRAAVAVVERFLSRLTFDRRASRDHIVPTEAVALRRILRELGMSDPYDERYFIAVAECIGRSCRAVGQLDLGPEDLRLSTRYKRQLMARSIDREKVLGVLLDVGARQPLHPLLGGSPSRESTQMVRKLEAGGIGPTNVENAKQLRADWTDHETRWRREVPGSDREWLDLRARVLDASARAELEIDRTQVYGEAMLRALNRRLQDKQLQGLTPFPLDDKLLLGLAFQLTDECRVWWSRDRDLVT